MSESESEDDDGMLFEGLGGKGMVSGSVGLFNVVFGVLTVAGPLWERAFGATLGTAKGDRRYWRGTKTVENRRVGQLIVLLTVISVNCVMWHRKAGTVRRPLTALFRDR